jgi:hypothetical protein
MKTQDIECHAAGQRFVGYLAADDARAGKRPGVLVAPEGGGLAELTRSIARRLAALGGLSHGSHPSAASSNPSNRNPGVTVQPTKA